MSAISIVENRDVIDSLSQLLFPDNAIMNERSSLKRQYSPGVRELADLNQRFQALRLSQEMSMMSISSFFNDSNHSPSISSYHYDSPHFDYFFSSSPNNG